MTSGSGLLAAAGRLSDAALLLAVDDLSSRFRRITVELLAHLVEVERRRLYRGLGCGRLFTYCTEVLKLSEAAAWNRIKAVRAARQFPVVLEMLADGRVNLTTIRLLEPHLTAANHRALLDEVRGMTRREVDKVVATTCGTCRTCGDARSRTAIRRRSSPARCTRIGARSKRSCSARPIARARAVV